MTKMLKIKDWGPALRFYWRFTGPMVKKIWYVWPIWLILLLSQLVEPYVYQNVFDEIVKIGTPEWESGDRIFWFIFVWAVVLLVSTGIMTLVRTIFSVKMPLVDKNYFAEAMQKVLALDMSFHLEKKSGEMMKKVDRAIDSFWNITLTLITNMIPKFILAIVVLIWAFSINWIMTLATISFYPVVIWVLVIGITKTAKLQDKANKLFDAAIGRAYDAVTNILVVKSFAQESKERARVMSKMNKQIHLQQETSVKWGRIEIWGDSLGMMQSVLIIAVGVYLMINAELTLGQLVMFTAFRRYLYEPVYAIAWNMRNLQWSILRVEEARKILERIDAIQDKPNAKRLKVTKGRVEMKNVTFKYQDATNLSRANLVFEPGEFTALVGHSGAGKSTITSLLNRFYDLQKGQILIDGQDISEVTQASLRRNLGLVMQENTLFNDTIYHNIAYAKPGVSRKEVYEAAKKANIHKFIMGLPKKYNTVVGERGMKLSGGEKQRVAIARVVLKNPPILILDEATSSLDSVNEKIIHKALEGVMKGRTSIVIAHRLSTVVDADKIVVINKGKVDQVGNHRSLCSKPGIYKELVDLQVGGLLAP
jgi:ABC-type multidrug transport system fused ATPase/permease subunit